MSEVLYRRWRPQSFAQVIGQDAIKTTLQNAVRYNRLAHAYLFTGPRGVGKTTLARLLAKAVNCLHPKDGEPDGRCENCKLIQDGRFLDLLEIDAASYTGVDNIRDIIDHVKFAPSRGRYKIFIIDEVHMLSKAAFNALLKTLEEPPAHAIFILATTEVHKVPATIISRAQRFDFKRISLSEILQLLEIVLKEEKTKVPREAQVLIAQAADGSFRDALSILDQLLSSGAKQVSLAAVEELLGLTRIEVSQIFLDLLITGRAADLTRFVKDLAFSGADLVLFTRNFLQYLRLVLLVKMAVEEVGALGLTAEEGERLKAQSARLPAARLFAIIRSLLEAHRLIKISPVPELPLLTEVLTLTENEPPAAAAAPALTKTPAVAKSARPLPPAADLGAVMDHWAQVLAKVKEYNHSLLSSLRLGRIVRLDGTDLILAFPYNFHKETIEARKNRIVVEQVLEEVLQQPFKIKVYLERELPKAPPPGPAGAGDLVSEALKVLGED